ncbi:MAG: glutathione S-transferase [Lachnospiraceae bacterium]|nr:glutathione S-transferase [Lachnospiraceae bacterium]
MAFQGCGLNAHQEEERRAKENEVKELTNQEGADLYTDEEAETHAREVGVSPRPRETRVEIDERGAFVRQPNAFSVGFGEKEGEWEAEKGRYRIFWATGCNWSNRPIIARDLLGLQDVISDQLVSHSGQSNKYGWGFPDKAGHKDPATGAYFLSEFYKNANPDFKGRATTPTLVDVEKRIAVNNDYHRLTNYIEVQFRKFQPEDAPDLYPKAYRREIDQFNDWLFPHINNGHYRMAFCQSYEAYQEAFDDFYDSMDKLDERLSKNRFLFGDYITDPDIRFYVTLVRWDLGYYRNIGPTKHRIVDYPNIWPYVRELYSIPAFHQVGFLEDQANRFHKEGEDSRPFRDYMSRIAWQADYEKIWAPDHDSRKKLSNHPDELFLRHPAGETAEDYQSEISPSPWNRPAESDRDPSNPANSLLDVDASVNPLKGKIDA